MIQVTQFHFSLSSGTARPINPFVNIFALYRGLMSKTFTTGFAGLKPSASCFGWAFFFLFRMLHSSDWFYPVVCRDSFVYFHLHCPLKWNGHGKAPNWSCLDAENPQLSWHSGFTSSHVWWQQRQHLWEIHFFTILKKCWLTWSSSHRRSSFSSLCPQFSTMSLWTPVPSVAGRCSLAAVSSSEVKIPPQ